MFHKIVSIGTEELLMDTCQWGIPSSLIGNALLNTDKRNNGHRNGDDDDEFEEDGEEENLEKFDQNIDASGWSSTSCWQIEWSTCRGDHGTDRARLRPVCRRGKS